MKIVEVGNNLVAIDNIIAMLFLEEIKYPTLNRDKYQLLYNDGKTINLILTDEQSCKLKKEIKNFNASTVVV